MALTVPAEAGVKVLVPGESSSEGRAGLEAARGDSHQRSVKSITRSGPDSRDESGGDLFGDGCDLWFVQGSAVQVYVQDKYSTSQVRNR